MHQPIYAVVDIETTGTDPKSDRIIQFGCVLIQNGEIINRFATDVNPGRKISQQIQSLTQITNARVQKAPYFEDVADIISNLLADTIFVAHNIYFDYKFLNHELRRCGAPILTIPGIDTVELAQIFLPTEESFRLSDLAESLGLEHDNPHQADSDAEVTGALLLYIQHMMEQLPLTTMEQIAALSQQTGMQTGDFIRETAAQMAVKPTPLPEELQIVDGIALRRSQPVLYQENQYQSHYPTKKKGKEHLFAGKLSFRKEQARLMNLVYQHFSSEDREAPKDLMIEAATGMGKSIGYLLPLNYLATPEQPVIISTVSLLLQDQLQKRDIPLLNSFLPQPIQATVIKSQRHYLDLQRFADSLRIVTEQKQYALYQMACLVWLTQTETGDFDELNLISLDHQFFQDVRHRGIPQLRRDSLFYEVDYLRRLHQRIKESNVLIVNHALLAQENLREKSLLPKTPFLIIDEAHHLPEICQKVATFSFNCSYFSRELRNMTAEDGLFNQLAAIFAEEGESLHLLSMYQEGLQLLQEAQNQFLEGFLTEADTEELLVTQEAIQELPLAAGRGMDQLLLFYKELQQLQQALQPLIEKTHLRRLPSENKRVQELMDLFEEMDQQAFVMTNWFTEWSPRYAHWLLRHENRQSATFRLVDFEAALLPQTKWYPRFEKILYIGGTLQIGTDRSYFPKRLGIPETQLKVIPVPFDYAAQTRILLPDQGITIQQLTPQEYTDYLVEILDELLKKNQRPALILFTSHDILQRVYGRMHMRYLEKGREILAQGVGGSREKLLKRFRKGENAILFGADSFWEGIDLPGEALQIVVVTRLPFDNPERPAVKVRNAYLEAQQINPFYEEAVPKAALKLRQAYGRLVRSETDKGILVILDRRILTTKYGRRIRKAFPKKVAFEEVPISQLREEADTFLEKE